MARRNHCAGAGVSVLDAYVVCANDGRGSCLAAALVSTYQLAEYWVHDSIPFCLKIGLQSHELSQAYKRFSVSCAAVLTAFNPLGEKSAPDHNTAGQVRLREQIQKIGYPELLAYGMDPNKIWPAEDSVLALGLALDAACELGRQYEQNAIVWCGPDAIPQLVLLR